MGLEKSHLLREDILVEMAELQNKIIEAKKNKLVMREFEYRNHFSSYLFLLGVLDALVMNDGGR
jgi:hypothetical protein